MIVHASVFTPAALADGSRSIGAVMLLAGLLIGGFFICLSVVNGRKAKASLAWPSVPGVVVFPGMTRDQMEKDKFYPSVTYSYEVNGQPFRSSQIGFSGVKSKRC